MRVLMFGWEFPPHISGGLGTACYGLTKSLVREDVELMFVVPKLHGSEPSEKMQLINASEVTIPLQTADNQHSEKISQKKITLTHSIEIPARVSMEKSTEQLTYVEVHSAIIPYSDPMVTERKWEVENWNYVFEPSQTRTEYQEVDAPAEVEQPVGYHYHFSGTYGPDLMEEVRQYALVSAQLASKYSHDVIHAHDWMTYPAGIEAKKISGKPLVIHVHATEFDRSGSCGGPVYDLELRGMKEADRIIAVSQWTKDIIVNHYDVDPDKVIVVHNGIIASDEESKNIEAPVGSHVVTFLGRVTHQKGPSYFVEAARKVSEEFPDAHFVVAGSGDLLPQMIERVAQLRMSHRFHFTGFLNKEWINRIWSISNVYVMPSVSEPFGITPLEAIQAGVPVIVSNQSGVAEVMPHALKVDFWDTEALAAAICSVLKYKSLSSMLKKKGENEIKHLSWKKAAVKLKSVYEELIP